MSLNFRYASSSPALNNTAATHCLLKEIKASNVHTELFLFVFVLFGWFLVFKASKKKPSRHPPRLLKFVRD